MPAFDPEEDVLDGVTVVATDEIAAVFALPEGSWFETTFKGNRGTECRVIGDQVWVWRDGRSRRPGICEIKRRNGAAHTFRVRFGRLRP